jgi:hypothetical protein
VVIQEDNQSAITMAHSDEVNPRRKHIDVKSIREQILLKKHAIAYVNTKYNQNIRLRKAEVSNVAIFKHCLSFFHGPIRIAGGSYNRA